jgi:hypothetical protein
MNSLFILKEVKMDIVNLYPIKRIKKKRNLNDLDPKLNFTQNIIEILKTSKISIKPYNNKTVHRIYLSRVNALKWVLEQSNDNNNLDKLQKIILSKIQQLKKEKKKATYRIETIRIIEEIDNLEFCLNAIVQDINKISSGK